MDLKIRTATQDDAPAIAQFQLNMAQETEDKQLDYQTVVTAVSEVFDDPYKGFYLVAQVDEKVVGSLLITFEWSDWRNANLWYFQSVYLVPEYRGMGIFSKMYHEVITLATNHGIYSVRLYVEKDNLHAQKVYEKLGMKQLPYYMYNIDTRM
ncbi:MAG: GNAT family N-acetyltransferase [Bacteroidia bacterium]|nr:GNAT family N-acetyltransferase [Bacteroidia bacterium]